MKDPTHIRSAQTMDFRFTFRWQKSFRCCKSKLSELVLPIYSHAVLNTFIHFLAKLGRRHF